MKNLEHSFLDTCINDDCLNAMVDIPDKSIDCIVTDLPYSQTARNSWDILIPFNDYVIIREKDKETILNEQDFLLYSFKNSKMNYEEALAYFKENKHLGLWSNYERIIKDNGAIILFANGMFTADMMESNKELWRYNLVWQKTQPTGFQNANRMPLRSHEDMCVFYKRLPTYNPQKTTGHVRKISTAAHKRNSKQSLNYNEIKNHTYDSTERFPRSVWKFSKDTQKSAIHATQKPVALIEEIIKTYTNKGDTILDSCAGSMTTAIAAINTGRHYVCIEKDKEIYNLGKQRVDDCLNTLS